MLNYSFFKITKYYLFSLVSMDNSHLCRITQKFSVIQKNTKFKTSSVFFYRVNSCTTHNKANIFITKIALNAYFTNKLQFIAYSIYKVSNIFFFWQLASSKLSHVLYTSLLQPSFIQQCYWFDNFFLQVSVNFFFSQHLL